MPAPRKPTKLLELTGAFKHDPKRAADRAEEPAPRGDIGPPPATMSAAGKKCWVEIVGLLPDGVGFDSDRVAMEQYAETLAVCRKNKWKVPDNTLKRMEAMYARFGMSPADRSRVKVAPKVDEKKNDPHKEFAKAPLKAVA